VTSAPFKLVIDARLHYDKGGKVTELMMEFLHASGMRSLMNLAKYDGGDKAEDVRAHFFDTPPWGESIMDQITKLLESGVEMPDGRVLPFELHEAHNLVGWVAVIETDGALSNHPCLFCKVRKPGKNEAGCIRTLVTFPVKMCPFSCPIRLFQLKRDLHILVLLWPVLLCFKVHHPNLFQPAQGAGSTFEFHDCRQPYFVVREFQLQSQLPQVLIALYFYYSGCTSKHKAFPCKLHFVLDRSTTKTSTRHGPNTRCSRVTQ
jgi:hypothetical protein